MKKIFKVLVNFIVFSIKAVFFMIILLIMFIGLTIYQNNSIKVSKEVYKSERLPDEFDGFKVLQLSDLHSQYFGENNKKLIDKIIKESPDLIFITGDLVDYNRFEKRVSISLIEEIIKVAPIYFVYGNHEMILNDDPENNEFKLALEGLGVNILNNKSTKIIKGDSYINLLGIQDPSTVYKDRRFRYCDTQEDIIREELNIVTSNIKDSEFNILLSHRPEFIDIYSEYTQLDLAFTGHAHGGQFRIPFIGGVYAPNQGFFPKYTAGVHVRDRLTMFISRGLGNSKIPIRIFNTPEIISVTLKTK